jgi:hypothetical protein
MNAARTRSRYYGVGVLCAVAMTISATLILLWWGFSLRTALVIAILISCPLAALYAWWLAQRALRSLNDTMRGATGGAQEKGAQPNTK